MENRIVFALFIFFVTGITTLGDYFLKLSGKGNSVHIPYFIIGLVIYFLSAFGWFYSYKFGKLSTVGPMYGIFTILFFTMYTVFFFKERISPMEMLGIALGVMALVLLSRFG
jgi:drug/metabolite transporter (DMT)-like permease